MGSARGSFRLCQGPAAGRRIDHRGGSGVCRNWQRNLVQGELSPAIAAAALATATALFTALVPMAELAARAINIAIKLKHPIYDCFYIALAEREDAVLITIDKRLLGIGKSLKGIELRAL